EDGIRDLIVTGVQTCALPIWRALSAQQPLVDVHDGRSRSRAELVAQQPSQLLERAQRLGGVAARLVDLHEQAVRRLAERREPEQIGRASGRERVESGRGGESE